MNTIAIEEARIEVYQMNTQRSRNILSALALVLLLVGYLLTRAESVQSIGRLLIILGAVLFVVTLIGSSLAQRKKPYHCPACGNQIKPVGRWVPGLGYNGTNMVTCPHCGATFSIFELEQKKKQ